jgi:hypothetical protein
MIAMTPEHWGLSDKRVIALIACLGLAMVITAVLAVRDRRLSIVLLLLSVVWLIVDRPFEGDVVVTVSHSHGLTGADFVGVVGGVVAVVLWFVPLIRKRNSAPPTHPRVSATNGPGPAD